MHKVQRKRIIYAVVTFLCLTTVLFADIPQIERDVLTNFYHSTGGDSWTNRSGWLGESGTECDWFGIGVYS